VRGCKCERRRRAGEGQHQQLARPALLMAENGVCQFPVQQRLWYQRRRDV
jgi:hypothetical protein